MRFADLSVNNNNNYDDDDDDQNQDQKSRLSQAHKSLGGDRLFLR